MRFLVDAQLPPALARWFAAQGHLAQHVADCGLLAASDREIWNFAESIHAVIVTKDEDFAARRANVAAGPAIVWIRRGNATRHDLLASFEPVSTEVVAAVARGERIVEVI
jgi:predicted nuclease of predicted toxin-antitoxin system